MTLAKFAPLAFALVLAGGPAVAQQASLRDFQCAPLQGNASPAFSLQCPIVDGEVAESCACPANFVLVDVEAAPAAIDPPAPLVVTPG